MDLFDNLPVAANVNGHYLAVHGGINPQLESFEMINSCERRVEPEESTLLSDLIWSDPLPDSMARHTDFKNNHQRGTAYMYGRRPLNKLLK